MTRARRIVSAVTIGIACVVSAPTRAQERGHDVGAQPARRKLTKMPTLLRFVPAEYPPAMKAAGIEAVVALTIEIGASGEITDVAVAQSASPDFDDAAIAAAKQLVWSPAEVDDKPAPSKITFRYSFILDAAPKPAAPVLPSSTPSPFSSLAAPSSTSPSSSPALPSSTSPSSAPASPSSVASSATSPAPAASSIDVEVRARPRATREPNQTTISAEHARKVAGSQGDVLKVVQNLPSVSRPPIASGQLVVWGSAPRDTRVYIDGVEVPSLYHGSGLRSVVSSDLVSSIDLTPGAFGAEYGRGLGGLVRVETRALQRGTHAYLSADTLDAAGLASTSFGDRARVAIALRQSWIDRVAAWVAPDVGDVFPIPRYRDGQVKATLDLRRNESIDAVVLGSTDDLTRAVPSPDPASARSERTHAGFWRAYLRYTNVSESGDAAVVTPFVGRDSNQLVQSFGAVPTHLDVASDRYGARASLRSKLGKSVTLTTGLDLLGTSSHVSRRGSLTLPPREGDISVFGQPPGDEVATDAWKTSIVDVAPNLHATLKLGAFTLTPGVRADAFLIDGSRTLPRTGLTPAVGFSRLETVLAPRASGRWEVTPRLALTAAFGQYHQAPEPEDLSPVFGTPELGLSRATHVTVGEALRITQSLTAEIIAFHKTMKDLVVRSRLTNPLVARALTQNGEGKSYGLSFLVRQELWHGFFGWVSYAISRSERRFEGDEAYRRFDFDQPHVLSVVGSQELGAWSIGARFRYASGNPRTPVVAATYDARGDRYDPVFGAQGSIRVPAFWQLDVRVDRTIALGRSSRVLIFADVQNVTNRSNAEEIVYSPSFREKKYITGLPLIAVVGARIDFR